MKPWASWSRFSSVRDSAVRRRLHPPRYHSQSWRSTTPAWGDNTASAPNQLAGQGGTFTSPFAVPYESANRTTDSVQSKRRNKPAQRRTARAPASSTIGHANISRYTGSSKSTAYSAGTTYSAKDDPRAAEWGRAIAKSLNNGATQLHKQALRLADDVSATHVWIAAAYWLLEHDIPNLLRLLEATHLQPYVPAASVDVLLVCLAEAQSRLTEKDSPEQLQRLVDVFCLLCHHDRDVSTVRTDRFTRLIMRICSKEQVAQMYQAIKVHGGISLPWATYLHFADRLVKYAHFEDGFDALMQAQKVGAIVNDYPFRSCSSTLLRRSSQQPEGLRVCLRIVSTLVELGLEMNSPICDIIMLNAVEAGDLNTTFSVYRLLKQRGLRPTVGTIAALLKGCKMKIDDVTMLNETIRDAVEYLNVRKSELVACEILHCLALHHCKHNPDTALETLTEAYAQFFDLEPLEKLGLPVPKIEQPPGEHMPPNQNALNIMIGISINQNLVHQAYDEGLLLLYRRWRHLVETGDRCCANLATSDYTANLFLMAFIQRPGGLIHATQVIHDMQEALPPTAGVVQAKPSVQTWSIFLYGFARHKKTHMAEIVLKTMRSVGMEPNPVTWNSLILGYARAQDEEGTLATIRRARETDMVWDNWTHGGLHALNRRERVVEEMRGSPTTLPLSTDAEDSDTSRMLSEQRSSISLDDVGE